MRKILTLVFLILLILLSACSPADNPAPTPTDAPQADVVVEPELESDTEPVGVQHSEAVCTAQAQAVGEDLLQDGDWVEGAEEGFTVTIIEYGDFQ